MANTAISALPAATSVANADTIPIVQGGTTKKAAVSLLPGSQFAVVGTSASPITDPATARPAVETVYWKCAVGVTPTNAVNGDLIWNAAS